MKDLLEAITIFAKYSEEKYPCWCGHDVLNICVDPAIVTLEDLKRLEELEFFPSEDEPYFYSFRFGS